MLIKMISVFIGGGIGSLFRYLVSFFSKKIFALPLVGTFLVNILGCFIIGYIFALTLNKADILPQTTKLFIVTGFLGGLTTFSTLNIEVFELINTGKAFYGILYMVISCLIGLLVAYLGYILFKSF